MKHFILPLFIVIGVGIQTQGLASTHKLFSANLRSEISALLASPRYLQILEDQNTIAARDKKEIRVHGLDVERSGLQTFAVARLVSRLQESSNPWVSAGKIIGFVSYDTNGEALINYVVFKGDNQEPGGSSVGNN